MGRGTYSRTFPFASDHATTDNISPTATPRNELVFTLGNVILARVFTDKETRFCYFDLTFRAIVWNWRCDLESGVVTERFFLVSKENLFIDFV